MKTKLKKKQNPPDLTTRNIRHANKEIAALKAEIVQLKAWIGRLEEIARSVKLLTEDK